MRFRPVEQLQAFWSNTQKLLRMSPARTLRVALVRFAGQIDRTSAHRAMRGTAASLLAYLAAALLHLEGPYWAAMTVWIVAQPSRGMLVGKSLARIAGTFVGVVAAVPLAWLAIHAPAVFVVALALWVGGCAALANTLTGFRVYVAVLGGFTAAIIAISSLLHPEKLTELSTSRVACILIGIVASSLSTWLWTPQSELGVLRQRATRTVEEACRWMGLRLSLGSTLDRGQLPHIEAQLTADIATIEAQCALGSGVASVRAERQDVRTLLLCIMDVLCAADALAKLEPGSFQFSTLPTTTEALSPLLSPAAARMVESEAATRLAEALNRLSAAEQSVIAGPGRLDPHEYPLKLHIDWPHARREGLRVALLLMFVGFGWMLTHLDLLLGALMGASILCSIFSTVETAKQATVGAVKGTIGAAVFVGAALPHAHSLCAILLALAPFMLLGGLALGDKLLAAMAMDYSMVLLLISGPAIGINRGFSAILPVLAGPILGAALTALAFQWVFPTSAEYRLRNLTASIEADVRRLSRPSRRINLRAWHARLLHRGLRLVVYATRSGANPERALHFALRTLNAGFSILHLRATVDRYPIASPERTVLESQLRSVAKSRAGLLRRPPLGLWPATEAVASRDDGPG